MLLSIALVEVALRLMNLGLGNSPIESDAYLHHVHPRSYQFVQQHPSGELGGFTITYDAERRVVRNTPLPPAGAPADCRIAFVGDSFTEAGQVRYEASFAAILESRAYGTCEVRNYGVRSYSPAIYLVQWEREISAWQPTHIFVLLFGNDVNDDRIYLQSAALDADGFPAAIQGPEGRVDDGAIAQVVYRALHSIDDAEARVGRGPSRPAGVDGGRAGGGEPRLARAIGAAGARTQPARVECGGAACADGRAVTLSIDGRWHGAGGRARFSREDPAMGDARTPSASCRSPGHSRRLVTVHRCILSRIFTSPKPATGLWPT